MAGTIGGSSPGTGVTAEKRFNFHWNPRQALRPSHVPFEDIGGPNKNDTVTAPIAAPIN
jgi:hypothetical protein